MKPTTVTAVWSGGGAKALAHAGAWRAMRDRGLEPRRIVGTSLGAVVGACFAAGMTYEEVLQAALGVTRREVASMSPLAAVGGIFAGSLLRGETLRETIGRLVPARTYDDLRLPLTITAVDMDSGDLELFGAGGRSDVPLVDALYASCALPVFYQPLELEGRRYGDGGLRATLPLNAVRVHDSDLVVAIDVGPGFDAPMPISKSWRRVPALIRAHNDAVRILMAQQTAHLLEQWKADGGAAVVLVRPVADREGTFATSKLTDYVELGYRATYRALAT